MSGILLNTVPRAVHLNKDQKIFLNLGNFLLDLDETSKAPTRCRAQQKVSQSANPSQALLSLKEHSRVSPQLSQHFSIKH